MIDEVGVFSPKKRRIYFDITMKNYHKYKKGKYFDNDKITL